MAVIKDTINPDNTVNYMATLAFFCCVSCLTLMLKFGGFKASLNFYNAKKKKELNSGQEMSMTGAYRTNRDEFLGYNNNLETQRRLTPTVRPTVPTEPAERPLRPAKSTSDLIKNKNLPPNLRLSNPNVSNDPRGVEQTDNVIPQVPERDRPKLDAEKKVEKQRQVEQKKLEKQRLEEQKKLEKQRAEEQKKREKQAAQEQAKQEKLRKEQEKKVQQPKKAKKKAPAPAKPLANPLAQAQHQYSTNTLESSISRSSGPPPYTEVPKELVKNEGDTTGNVSFSKPIDTGSWDLITEHRQQISRTVNSKSDRKQMVMDLNYRVDNNVNETRGNSDA